MKTTLYNHNALGSADKPLIPNIEFKRLVEEIEKGNMSALPEALKKYSLESFQKQFVIHLQKEISCKIN